MAKLLIRRRASCKLVFLLRILTPLVYNGHLLTFLRVRAVYTALALYEGLQTIAYCLLSLCAILHLIVAHNVYLARRDWSTLESLRISDTKSMWKSCSQNWLIINVGLDDGMYGFLPLTKDDTVFSSSFLPVVACLVMSKVLHNLQTRRTTRVDYSLLLGNAIWRNAACSVINYIVCSVDHGRGRRDFGDWSAVR